MHPFQKWRASAYIFHRRPADKHDFGASQRMVALIETCRRILPITEIPINGPLRPSSAQLDIKPSPGIDDFYPWVDAGNSVEYLVRHLRDHQNLDVVHMTRLSRGGFGRHNTDF